MADYERHPGDPGQRAQIHFTGDDRDEFRIVDPIGRYSMRWWRATEGWNAQGEYPRTPTLWLRGVGDSSVGTVARAVLRQYAVTTDAQRQVDQSMDVFMDWFYRRSIQGVLS